ncbi:MAG: glycine--tRNA ligase [Phycisphaerales bacterium]|nr:glycine--tRNA ligase [Phycisphaerales bacterium]
MAEQTGTTMEKIVALCKRRGFIFQSSEIYGGIGGFWDYGPLGCELKRNIKEAWWQDMVRNPPLGPKGVEFQMVGVDCAIIMNSKVWVASGHVGGFKDPMVACKADGCKKLFRADQVWTVELLPEGVYDETGFDASFTKEGFSLAVRDISLMKNRRTWIASTQVDGVAEALNDVESAINRAGKQFKSAQLKSTRVVARAQKHTLALFKAVDDDGNRYQGVVSRLDAIPRSQFPDSPNRNIAGPCPVCGGDLTDLREFNLMFDTHTGALREEANRVYLRPETAQGIFVNFKNVMDSSRVKIPFGIAQIGKAFRNEINPRNYTFRSREFEQMEIEFFCKPDELCADGEPTAMEWYEFWRNTRIKWYESLGIRSDKLRPRQQGAEELAHYSRACTDIEYMFPFSNEPQELEGVAHRGSFDLNQHGKFARGDENAFAVIDDETKKKYVPHVIEPSAGADRFTLAVITEAYTVDETRASPEFMRFHPRLAPIKAAVFPLVAKDGLPEIAEPIYRAIKTQFPAQYDAKQSIGKRYARMDEAGTPFCFTIDGQSKEDGTVTVRNRDDASQSRIDRSRCLDYLRDKLTV